MLIGCFGFLLPSCPESALCCAVESYWLLLTSVADCLSLRCIVLPLMQLCIAAAFHLIMPIPVAAHDNAQPCVIVCCIAAGSF
uniref:Secreted protein n=1 Tax=Pyxicephalus adspersus TaxID=30357 RepID=A0AAV3AT87_PYXAD|nr:TPA: hypothetical protein GDO54_007883 [Pyxicephalus adspersus]